MATQSQKDYNALVTIAQRFAREGHDKGFLLPDGTIFVMGNFNYLVARWKLESGYWSNNAEFRRLKANLKIELGVHHSEEFIWD